MTNMLRLLCVLALTTCATAQFFSHLGDHEHSELGSFSFFYDPKSHYIVGRTTHNCYFMSLGANEQHDVHTNTGLETSELKMIQMIGGGETEMTTDQIIQHSHVIDYMCRHHKMYMVGEVSTQSPVMVTTPLV
ncbi:uncharacterized protein LOC110463972 [Mizuhopecten yessoensis]|uniref:uncharacterized protein LOC110463972 n=1 Tax=Mizuhopecten yessoensis TaxID=6573 RepID=UPI000B45BAC9|nr:uncharacterized protein LOC110463972 [Mizuhopecten yessoensis]